MYMYTLLYPLTYTSPSLLHSFTPSHPHTLTAYPFTTSLPHPSQWHGVLEEQIVVCINGQYMTSRFCHTHPSFLALLNPMEGKAPPPLHLTVLRMSSEYVKLCPLSSGLGFHIKGSAPVIIHGVDKGGEKSYYLGLIHLSSSVTDLACFPSVSLPFSSLPQVLQLPGLASSLGPAS